MTKHLLALVLLFCLVTCFGCAKAESSTPSVFDASMFMCVENQADWKVVAHRETHVMYAVSTGGYNRGTFTLLVDADGNPMLWEDTTP